MNQQEFQNKQLRMMQIQTAILAAILILLLAAGIFLAVQLADLGHLMDLMEQQLLALDLEQINQAVASLTDTVDAMDMKDHYSLSLLIFILLTILLGKVYPNCAFWKFR